jgi:hypothetical protein
MPSRASRAYRHHHQPGRARPKRPSTTRPSAPGSDPDPGPRLRHWPTCQYPMAVTARRLVSRHPSQYPEAHGPSVPRARLGGPCCVGPARLSRRAERPATQPSESQRARSDHPTSQRCEPSPSARPGALHRATASARAPIPTQARASATGGCGTGQHFGLGAERHSGGDQRLHSPTAWLPPGHEPGAVGGMVTTAQQ